MTEPIHPDAKAALDRAQIAVKTARILKAIADANRGSTNWQIYRDAYEEWKHRRNFG